MFGFIFSRSSGNNETFATKQEVAEFTERHMHRHRVMVDAIQELENDVSELERRIDDLTVSSSELSKTAAALTATIDEFYSSLTEAAELLGSVTPPVVARTSPDAAEGESEPQRDADATSEDDAELSFTVPQVPGYVYAGAIVHRMDVPNEHASYLPDGIRWEVLRVDGNRVFYRTLD